MWEKCYDSTRRTMPNGVDFTWRLIGNWRSTLELSEKDLFEYSIYFSERAYAELELDKPNELDWMIVRCTEWKYEWT